MHSTIAPYTSINGQRTKEGIHLGWPLISNQLDQMGCPNNYTRYTFAQRRQDGLELQQAFQHLITSALTTSSEVRQSEIHSETAQGFC